MRKLRGSKAGTAAGKNRLSRLFNRAARGFRIVMLAAAFLVAAAPFLPYRDKNTKPQTEKTASPHGKISIGIAVPKADPLDYVRSIWNDALGRQGVTVQDSAKAKQFDDMMARQFDDAREETLLATVQNVNGIVNTLITYADDATMKGKVDHWATPFETLQSGKGDCEDYSLLKYFALMRLGVDDDRIRLLLVGAQSRNTVDHAVLIVNVAPEGQRADWRMLDNDGGYDALPFEKSGYTAFYACNLTDATHAAAVPGLTGKIHGPPLAGASRHTPKYSQPLQKAA